MGKLPEQFATLVLLLATSGLRISEAIGLKRSDIEGNSIKVSSAQLIKSFLFLIGSTDRTAPYLAVRG